MYVCKYHTKATKVDVFGYATIRPNEKFAVIKKNDRFVLGFIERQGRSEKVTIKGEMIRNFIKL